MFVRAEEEKEEEEEGEKITQLKKNLDSSSKQDTNSRDKRQKVTTNLLSCLSLSLSLFLFPSLSLSHWGRSSEAGSAL